MSQSDSGIFYSLSPFDLFGCVCLLQSGPSARFGSCEVKNLIYFPPQCRALSLLVFFFLQLPLSLSLSGLFSFTINLLLLSVTVVSCALWIFSLFAFDSLQQNIIICQNGSASELCLVSDRHTHTHASMYMLKHTHVHTQTHILLSGSSYALYTFNNAFARSTHTRAPRGS